jgi:hypothetical protein
MALRTLGCVPPCAVTVNDPLRAVLMSIGQSRSRRRPRARGRPRETWCSPEIRSRQPASTYASWTAERSAKLAWPVHAVGRRRVPGVLADPGSREPTVSADDVCNARCGVGAVNPGLARLFRLLPKVQKIACSSSAPNRFKFCPAPKHRLPGARSAVCTFLPYCVGACLEHDGKPARIRGRVPR